MNHSPTPKSALGNACHHAGNLFKGYEGMKKKIECALQGWLWGLSARLLFAATLFMYYINSGLTKFGDGFLGLFPPSSGAFAQILPPIAEHYTYDVSAIPLFPWHFIVIAGTLNEFILPSLIVLGLFTRLAAVGMIGFITVQTVVDVVFHGATLGALFNGQPQEMISQRLFWLFLLGVLIAKGAGSISLDHWLYRALKSYLSPR
jgi:putative oxidoreductase